MPEIRTGSKSGAASITKTVAVASKKAGSAKSAATTDTLALLAKAIRTMPDDVARANVVTAYRTMARANPSLVCEKQCAAVKAVLASSACSSAKTIAVAGNGDCLGRAAGATGQNSLHGRALLLADEAGVGPGHRAIGGHDVRTGDIVGHGANRLGEQCQRIGGGCGLGGTGLLAGDGNGLGN